MLALACLSTALMSKTPKIHFVKYTLQNGLKIILHQDNSVPALYHVGSKNEDTGRAGFAHFFEHLLFEGSENIKRGGVDKYVTGAGVLLMLQILYLLNSFGPFKLWMITNNLFYKQMAMVKVEVNLLYSQYHQKSNESILKICATKNKILISS